MQLLKISVLTMSEEFSESTHFAYNTKKKKNSVALNPQAIYTD
jgi:hypothetical protein